MQVVESERKIPVYKRAEVVIAGGGPSGIMAAVTCARKGIKTLLVERYGFLGGMATVGLVGPFSGFAIRGERVLGGFPWEFVSRIREKGGAIVIEGTGNIAFDPEAVKIVAQRMLEEEGCDIILHSLVVGAIVEKGEIKGIIVENKSGRGAILGKVVIDATGDADIAHFCGAEYEKTAELQPMSLCFRMGNVDTDNLSNLFLGSDIKRSPNGANPQIREKMIKAYREGELSLFGGPWILYGSTVREGEVSLNVTRVAGDATDAEEITRAELKAREDMHKIVEFLKKNFTPFRNSFILDSALQIGIRETRRITGEYKLTANDILKYADFPDSIARGCHPIDIHDFRSEKQRIIRLKRWYSIPYRCMIPQKVENLVVTGRAISSTREAFASVRVQGTCMALGQAAGCAAALCVGERKTPRKLNWELLRGELKKQGALV